MREVDNIGGLDQYLLSMSDSIVRQSNYVTKIRERIGSKLYHEGLLHPVILRKLGYHKNPPPKPEEIKKEEEEKEEKEGAAKG